ncbi:MAG: hypothetical protein JWQ03_919 [Variovorax sp.]|nr:hypothetical protein [Variovorax sp.]
MSPVRMLGWHALTWLGDSGLLLPSAVLIALWLALASHTREAAWRWVLLFGAASGVVLASKLAFMGWGIGSARFNFTGFSGHTAFAASVWPVALWLLASRRGHLVRVTAALMGWALAGVIGVSRLALGAHSISEVAAGYLLGMAVSTAFLAFQWHRPRPQVRVTLVALSLLLPLAFLAPGQAAPTQDALERIAVRLSGSERPFERMDLYRSL